MRNMDKVLIVDDDMDIVYLVGKLLKKAGYRVIDAYSGKECLEKIKEKPDLVLLDIMMPDIDGWEVCKRIKENPFTRLIPVAMLSVRRSEEDVRRSYDYAHADAHIAKPLNRKELISAVEFLTGKTREIETSLIPAKSILYI